MLFQSSGLDSSSALLVMKSLKALVDTQGVTILSVIHQPRKFIFELFDSVILLGVGGNMVYHGPVSESEQYFARLPEPYRLPAGESIADWLIDVSSGRLEPENNENIDSDRDLGTVILDNAAVGTAGPSSSKVDTAYEEAKLRRQVLYDAWNEQVLQNENVMTRLKAPEPYDLPVPVKNRSFFFQLNVQVRRNLLLAWRNRFSKFVDTAIILVAVSLICLFEGVVNLTREDVPGISFEDLTSGNPEDLGRNFRGLFRYASSFSGLVRFAMALGVIASVLLSLMASKAITQYRHEFFREAGSGYSISAYFLAVNITSFLEHSTQMILAALAAFWFRDSIAIWWSYVSNFLLLSWTCSSWYVKA
jgi:ABC-2 type transporter